MKSSTSYIVISTILIITGAVLRDIVHVSLVSQRYIGLFVLIFGIVLLTTTVSQIIRANKKSG